MSLLRRLIRECDELAARHWERAAGDRAESYRNWLNHLKKATIEIKNEQNATKKTQSSTWKNK